MKVARARATLVALIAAATALLPPAVVAYHDADIANFLLNVECFEAEYFCWSAFGHGLNEVQRGGGPPSIGGRKAELGPIQAVAEEFARNDVAHLETIRAALGALAVPCPLIDLGDPFAEAADYAVNSSLPFSPFDSPLNWLLGALVFQDAVPMAYNWAVTVLRDPDFVAVASRIVGTEAYQAGFIRSALADAHGQDTPGVSHLLPKFLRIGDEIVGELLGLPGLPGHPPTALLVGTLEKAPRIAPVDLLGLTFAVDASSILNLMYLTFDPSALAGGFFPMGFNGLLGKTRGELVDVCSGTGTVRRYHQCGGAGYEGPTCCEGYNTCVTVNEFYSSCQPTPVPPNVVKWYGQCGGRHYQGPVVCEPDSTCVFKSSFYSQCVPTA